MVDSWLCLHRTPPGRRHGGGGREVGPRAGGGQRQVARVGSQDEDEHGHQEEHLLLAHVLRGLPGLCGEAGQARHQESDGEGGRLRRDGLLYSRNELQSLLRACSLQTGLPGSEIQIGHDFLYLGQNQTG